MTSKRNIIIKIGQLGIEIVFFDINIQPYESVINRFENFIVNNDAAKIDFTLVINITQHHNFTVPSIEKNTILLSIKSEINGYINIKKKLAVISTDDSLNSLCWIIGRVYDIASFLLYSTVTLHASSVEMNGKATVFFGPQGVGKSTILTLCNSRIISDDYAVIQYMGNIPYVFSTPFDRKLPLVENLSFPLNRMFYLEQAPYNKIADYDGNLISLLINNMRPNLVYYRNSSVYMKRIFLGSARLISKIRVDKLYFKNSEEVKELII